jgi:hypothetical protein
MANYPVVKDNIKLNNLLDLFRIHFFIKLLEKNVTKEILTERELSIICELYKFGGLQKRSDLNDFTQICVDKELTADSLQSVRNVLGKARLIGIVKRPKANKWVISNDYLPPLDTDKIILDYTIHNLDL